MARKVLSITNKIKRALFPSGVGSWARTPEKGAQWNRFRLLLLAIICSTWRYNVVLVLLITISLRNLLCLFEAGFPLGTGYVFLSIDRW